MKGFAEGSPAEGPSAPDGLLPTLNHLETGSLNDIHRYVFKAVGFSGRRRQAFPEELLSAGGAGVCGGEDAVEFKVGVGCGPGRMSRTEDRHDRDPQSRRDVHGAAVIANEKMAPFQDGRHLPERLPGRGKDRSRPDSARHQLQCRPVGIRPQKQWNGAMLPDQKGSQVGKPRGMPAPGRFGCTRVQGDPEGSSPDVNLLQKNRRRIPGWSIQVKA